MCNDSEHKYCIWKQTWRWKCCTFHVVFDASGPGHHCKWELVLIHSILFILFHFSKLTTLTVTTIVVAMQPADHLNADHNSLSQKKYGFVIFPWKKPRALFVFRNQVNIVKYYLNMFKCTSLPCALFSSIILIFELPAGTGLSTFKPCQTEDFKVPIWYKIHLIAFFFWQYDVLLAYHWEICNKPSHRPQIYHK